MQQDRYNAKGEVVTANHSTKNEFDRAYEFDGIGNRKKSADSLTLPATDNYTANALNQYGSIDGNTRSFDEDGNLVDDGSKIYTWDAENQLIEVKDKASGNIVVTYIYDYRGRRITKITAPTETHFIYDGWNPIAEFSHVSLRKTYTWGMDVSSSLRGAGGVGGLLSVNDGSDTYYPTYDGNGNVSEYVDVTGSVVAHYEYDTFGKVVATGSKKDDFTHQFSTKQLDSESGLNYYGYRYYEAGNGRWLGRDPAQERGGLNLFGFVRGDAINKVDLLGLDETSDYIGVMNQDSFTTTRVSSYDFYFSVPLKPDKTGLKNAADGLGLAGFALSLIPHQAANVTSIGASGLSILGSGADDLLNPEPSNRDVVSKMTQQLVNQSQSIGAWNPIDPTNSNLSSSPPQCASGGSWVLSAVTPPTVTLEATVSQGYSSNGQHQIFQANEALRNAMAEDRLGVWPHVHEDEWETLTNLPYPVDTGTGRGREISNYLNINVKIVETMTFTAQCDSCESSSVEQMIEDFNPVEP